MSLLCRGCGERIDFVVIKKSGKRHPVDEDSLQSYTLTPGTVVITEDEQILRGSEETKNLVVRGYQSHFATHTQAESFRKK